MCDVLVIGVYGRNYRNVETVFSHLVRNVANIWCVNSPHIPPSSLCPLGSGLGHIDNTALLYSYEVHMLRWCYGGFFKGDCALFEFIQVFITFVL